MKTYGRQQYIYNMYIIPTVGVHMHQTNIMRHFISEHLHTSNCFQYLFQIVDYQLACKYVCIHF